jgi:hypothetical protein
MFDFGCVAPNIRSLVKEAVHLSRSLNEGVGKTIDYVICTNLALLNDEHLEFCERYNILISTSLDGPVYLHDKNRPMAKGRQATTLSSRYTTYNCAYYRVQFGGLLERASRIIRTSISTNARPAL